VRRLHAPRAAAAFLSHDSPTDPDPPPGVYTAQDPDAPVDIWRDTPVRYMGYANEVGESFAAFLPPWGVAASYGVAGECPPVPPPPCPSRGASSTVRPNVTGAALGRTPQKTS
jgi:hypothetical protein